MGVTQAGIRYNITGNSSGLVDAAKAASVAIAAIGAAAIKVAADIDRSFTKIITLVGLSEDSVNSMERSTKRLAKTTGVSAQQAADALFQITSAGFRGSEAMKVLERSLKASAIGLGETKVIADLVTSAINAMGSENLSAAEATNILTKTVRLGKLEADTLAGAFGSVLPIASALGVSMDELGAAFASLSQTGTKASEAATQINRVLASLLKTSPQAERAFNEMGLSSASLRDVLAGENGLYNVLDILRVAVDGNVEAAGRLFPNIRALKGVLDLTGKNAGKTSEIFKQLALKTDDVDEGFEKLQGRLSFQLDNALNSLKTSFTNLGKVLLTALLPLIKKVTGFFERMLEAFVSLDPWARNVAVAIGLIVLAIGPLTILLPAIKGLFIAMTGPIGLTVAALAAVAYVIYKNWNEVLPVIVGFTNSFIDLYNRSLFVRVGIAAIVSIFKSLAIIGKGAFDLLTNSFNTFWGLIKEAATKGFGGDFAGIIAKGLQGAIDIIDQAGKDVGDEFVKGYKEALDNQLEHVTTEGINASLTEIGSSFKNLFKNLFSGGGGSDEDEDEDEKEIKVIPDPDPEQLSKWKEYLGRLKNLFGNFGENLKSFFNDGLAAVITDTFAAMGTALAEGGNVIKAIGKAVLGTIGQFLQQLGTEAVKLGVLAIGFAKAIAAIKKWIIANPATAIVAGIALVALGAAFSASANKSADSISGGGSRGSTASPVSAGTFTPTAHQENGGRPEIVGVLRGQDLVLQLQAANRIRPGLT